MKLTKCLIFFIGVLSVWYSASGDEVSDLCDSVPGITIKTMEGYLVGLSFAVIVVIPVIVSVVVSTIGYTIELDGL